MINECGHDYIRLILSKVTLFHWECGHLPNDPLWVVFTFQNKTPNRKQGHPAAKYHIQATSFKLLLSLIHSNSYFSPNGAEKRPDFIGFISFIFLHI